MAWYNPLTWLGLTPEEYAEPVQEGERTKQQAPNRLNANAMATTDSEHNITTPKGKTIKTWREMRYQPTIALARAVHTAGLRVANFVAKPVDESVPEEYVDWINEEWKKLWRQFIHDQIYALDYGWSSYEKIWRMDGNRQSLERLKFLVPENTTVLVDPHGNYAGLKNGEKKSGGFMFKADNDAVVLSPNESFWYPHEKEGSNWYGESIMERARHAYNSWNEVDARAARYYQMSAAPIPMVHYPTGEAEDETGQTVETFRIAQKIMQGLSNCRGLTMPNVLAAYADTLVQSGADPDKLKSWIIDFVDPGTPRGDEFTNRQKKQNETDMMRAWLVPERAATEGTHGTKAEAEAHASLLVTQVGVELEDMLDWANKGIVNQQLALNFGVEAVDTVTLEPEPITDEEKAVMTEIAKGIFGAPNNADLALELLDIEQVIDLIGLPKAKEMAEAINRMNEEPKAPTLPPMAPQPPAEPEPEAEDEQMSLPDEPEDGDVAWFDTTEGRQYYVAQGKNWKPTTLSIDHEQADTEEGPEADRSDTAG